MTLTPYESLLADLADEHASLDAVVAPLDAAALLAPTPADEWKIADQLAHLAGFDEAATFALTDPDAFIIDVDRRIAEGNDPIAEYTARGRDMGPVATRDWWRRARADLLTHAAKLDPKARIPWYGPPMSAMSFLTARLMETWAHGQDVRDAVGCPPEATSRLRHVAHIGVGARAFSYLAHGLEAPDAPIDVVLDAPGGDTWSWGPGDATDRVTGPALDFCLLVTQRRHVKDTDLVTEGAGAEQWISIAQAFAGAPGAGRTPGQFV